MLRLMGVCSNYLMAGHRALPITSLEAEIVALRHISHTGK